MPHTTIKFGLALQNYFTAEEYISPRSLVNTAIKAEKLGFDSVWVWGHLLLGSKNVFPIHESLTILTAVACYTEHVKLATGVLVLPLRNPVELAKRISTIDHLSNGRIILGVAAGWYEREFQACGVPFNLRGKILERNITILRRLWTESQINGSYDNYQFKNVTMEPKPLQKPCPQIWMGGYTKKVHERLSKLADGWISYFYKADDFKESWQNILENVKRFGRDPMKMNNCDMVPIRMGDTKEVASQILHNFVKKYCDLPSWSKATVESGIAGNSNDFLNAIQRYEQAGVQTLVIMPAVTALSEIDTQVERFAKEVMPSI